MTLAIELHNVSKKFGLSYAVNDVSLTVEEGELITILGSSGSGKTTTLKMINRLYEPDEGKIILFGEDIQTVDVIKVRRRIGYVIQQVGLFPHMTVGQNIATVPKLMGWDKQRTSDRIDELLELVGLGSGEFRDRYPSQLSGGQQQRVGLARGLAVDPKIMLLDEPFGALDSITRLKMQDELLNLHTGLKKTFLFVTHDIEEAFKLGSRVIIMNDSRLVQYDTPQEIIRHPANAFVESLMNAARQKEQIWETYR